MNRDFMRRRQSLRERIASQRDALRGAEAAEPDHPPLIDSGAALARLVHAYQASGARMLGRLALTLRGLLIGLRFAATVRAALAGRGAGAGTGPRRGCPRAGVSCRPPDAAAGAREPGAGLRP